MSPRDQIRFICSGCQSEWPAMAPYPFRCPQARAGDNIDHVLERRLRTDGLIFPAATDPNPFLTFRELLYSTHMGRRHGFTDGDYCHMVRRLDTRIRDIDGTGFVQTPFNHFPKLAQALELPTTKLWVKNETGNVSGSHKGRHLMGVMIHLELAGAIGLAGGALNNAGVADERAEYESGSLDKAGGADGRAEDKNGSLDKAGGQGEAPPLAIASCGNAALAAAVVAKAAARRLEVFIPPDASPSVVERLRRLDARLHICERDDRPGDPCYHGFQDALSRGAIPFCCQGPDNGLNIEGGRTLAYELVHQLQSVGRLDRLFVQVGGGALASATLQGLEEALRMGAIESMPRIYVVQTFGAYPLSRAYERLVARLLERLRAMGKGDTPTSTLDEKKELQHSKLIEKKAIPHSKLERAAYLATELPPGLLEETLHYAATHRSEFMWPWEETPHSVAHGILDDETYDWLAILRGLIRSGGFPITVDEATLRRAQSTAVKMTGIPVDPTGAAGLAGLLHAKEELVLTKEERVGVLFTGRIRS